MISDSYSTARMWALTKRHCVENRKNIAITISVIFGLLLLSAILITKSMYDPDFQSEDSRAGVFWACACFAIGIIVQILGSLTFSAMSTKPKRISNLMLPAAQSEKFISQCLIHVVGGNLVLILSVVLADTISALIFSMTPGWYMFFDAMWNKKFAIDPNGHQMLCMIFLCILWCFLISQSLFVLGSAFWPRKSFLKTFVALFALEIIMPIIIPIRLVLNFSETIERFFRSLADLSANEIIALWWCAIAVAYALLALVYWLAWRRYKNMAVVKRFMMD